MSQSININKKTLNQYIKELIVEYNCNYKDIYPLHEEAKRITGSNCGKDTFCAKVRNTGRKFLQENGNVDTSIQSSNTTKPFTERTSVNDKEMIAERLFTREPQSLEDVESMYNIDKKIWICTSFTVSNWDTTSTRVGKTATNYAVKAMFKRRVEIINYDELKEKFINDVKNYKPTHEPVKYKLKEKSKMLEICVYDLHFGKLALNEETKDEYDHKIARRRFLYAVQDLIEKVSHYDIERILFVLGNDFFNYDTMTGTTTGGTPQDFDLMWQQLFSKGCDVLIEAIDIMKNICPVDVMWVPGNHDMVTSFYATTYIDAWYRNCKDVNVDTGLSPRKYYIYGNTLLGFTHGKEEGKRLASLMSIEQGKHWGNTKYHHFHIGHLHSEHIKEESGVIITNVSSVCGNDSWHNLKGFRGATKKAQAFLWDYELGLSMTINSVII